MTAPRSWGHRTIRTLLKLVDGDRYTCAQVKRITVYHLDDVRRKIADLRKIERMLGQIAAQCGGAHGTRVPRQLRVAPWAST
jgi:MerR, DNA binding